MKLMKKVKSFILVLSLVIGGTALAQVPAQEGEANLDVKDSELEEFADVYQQLMERNQEVQQEVVGMIEDEGLSIETYQKMREADMNPDANVEDVSDDDKEKKEKIDGKIKELEPKIQKEQEEIIEKSDLGSDRYNEIAMALQNDEDLQQKIQSILVERMQGEQGVPEQH